MLSRLLESNPGRRRPVWGTVISTLAHTTAIAAAVFATAQARIDDPAPPDVIRWVSPPPPAPARAAPPGLGRPVRSSGPTAKLPLPDLRFLDHIDVKPVEVDLLAAQLTGALPHPAHPDQQARPYWTG